MKNKIDFLIIDDDFDTITFLTGYLKSQGYTCDYAISVKRGLEILETKIPSVILLDVLLPDKKGYEIIKPVKKNPLFNHILIYLLTAIPIDEAIEKVKEYDIDGVLGKPFSLEELETIFKEIKR
jgi:DNA-binding response OmpR family regulator